MGGGISTREEQMAFSRFARARGRRQPFETLRRCVGGGFVSGAERAMNGEAAGVFLDESPPTPPSAPPGIF